MTVVALLSPAPKLSLVGRLRGRMGINGIINLRQPILCRELERYGYKPAMKSAATMRSRAHISLI